MTFGEKVKKARKEMGFTQTQLAEKVGVSAKGKVFLIIGIIICVCLCACSGGDNVSESMIPSLQVEESEISEEASSSVSSGVPEASMGTEQSSIEQTPETVEEGNREEIEEPHESNDNDVMLQNNEEKLLASAEILTKQLALTIFQSSDISESSAYPFDNAELDRFLVSTVLFTDDEKYIYHSFFPIDDQGYYHFQKEKCEKILKEVFEIEEWEFMDETGMQYDSELNEYTIMSGFGIGNGMECKSVESLIKTPEMEIVVYYELYKNSQFLNKQETRFLIQKAANNSFSLKYIDTTPQS